jgi:hypothetical protein
MVEPANAPHIGEELEKARQSLHESLAAGPESEILPPLERVPSMRPRISPRRERAVDISDG